MTDRTGLTAIDDYLREVDARLLGPASLRDAVVVELADGLRCASAERQRQGHTAGEAAAAAIAEFGDPTTVARAFAPEIALAQARRVALRLVRSGPAIGAIWLLAILATVPVPAATEPWWRRAAAAMLGHVPLLPVAIACTAAAAVVVFALTGRTLRVLPSPRAAVAPYVAVAVAVATAGGDIALLASLPSVLGHPAPALPLAVAAAASLARLATGGWWAHQCLIVGRRTSTRRCTS